MNGIAGIDQWYVARFIFNQKAADVGPFTGLFPR
jgi:hypothetical protein